MRFEPKTTYTLELRGDDIDSIRMYVNQLASYSLENRYLDAMKNAYRLQTPEGVLEHVCADEPCQINGEVFLRKLRACGWDVVRTKP